MTTPLVIVTSLHRGNTVRLARAIAEKLGARVVAPEEADAAMLEASPLTGFGSGIYSDQLHDSILDLAARLPGGTGKRAFIFSTSGIPVFVTGRRVIENYCFKCHATLRTKLVAAGYSVAGEFGCAGHNTNSFLRFFGGFNKGLPGPGDLQRAAVFAARMGGTA
jgi:flavodoxin